MNNPPAFPRPYSQRYEDDRHSAQAGMTLRDYFAAKAMQGMLCNGFAPAMGQDDYEDFNYAKIAYAMADAMLAERSKEQ